MKAPTRSRVRGAMSATNTAILACMALSAALMVVAYRLDVAS